MKNRAYIYIYIYIYIKEIIKKRTKRIFHNILVLMFSLLLQIFRYNVYKSCHTILYLSVLFLITKISLNWKKKCLSTLYSFCCQIAMNFYENDVTIIFFLLQSIWGFIAMCTLNINLAIKMYYLSFILFIQFIKTNYCLSKVNVVFQCNYNFTDS